MSRNVASWPGRSGGLWTHMLQCTTHEPIGNERSDADMQVSPGMQSASIVYIVHMFVIGQQEKPPVMANVESHIDAAQVPPPPSPTTMPSCTPPSACVPPPQSQPAMPKTRGVARKKRSFANATRPARLTERP